MTGIYILKCFSFTIVMSCKKGDEFFYNARVSLYKLENTFDFFEKALYHYFLAYKINQNNVELNFKIGEALFHTSRMHDANFYLTKAINSNNELEDYEFYLDALKSKLDNDYYDCIKKLKWLFFYIMTRVR